MVQHPRPNRAFEFVVPVDIYRVIGRRPSSVWVDATGAITAAGPPSQQLKETVYAHGTAAPGEQLQERVGGLFLVAPDGTSEPVILSSPRPIDPQTAFEYARVSREDDLAIIETLLASGALRPVKGYRLSQKPSRPGDRVLTSDHPLVVEELPDEIDATPDVPTENP